MFHQQFKKTSFRYLLTLSVILLSSLFLAKNAEAAALYMSPASAKVSTGNIVSVKVLVNTEGKAINNVESVVQFPADLLEVMSISKSSSIFTLWVEDPKFSNFSGTINLNGGLPSPGYTGSNGEVVSIVFKAKKTGNASVVFGDSAVRQNDGLGTDILTSRVPASLEIKASEVVQDVQVPTAAGSPTIPIISSITHPDQNKWYNTNDVELKWTIPSGVTAVSTSISHAPAQPTVLYEPPINNKKLPNLEDGTWYFNLRFKNNNGWGTTAHFKIQIDTTPPDAFKISYPHGETSEDPRPVILFNTTDKASGVDHYEIKIGESQFNRIAINDVSSNPYTPEPQDPGKHPILVKAVDLAGNETVQSSEFTIIPINTPIITDYPNEIDKGDLLRMRGTSYPLSSVEVVVTDSKGNGSSQITNVQIDGSWGMIWAKALEIDSYTVKARAIDKREAKSEFSKPLNFIVKTSAITQASTLVLNWLSVIIILILLIGGSVLLITYFINKNLKIKKSIRRDIKSAELSIHKAFKLLRENVSEQITTLEKAKSKRALTKEEEKVIKNLQENLTKSEEFLEEEITNIEEKVS